MNVIFINSQTSLLKPNSRKSPLQHVYLPEYTAGTCLAVENTFSKSTFLCPLALNEQFKLATHVQPQRKVEFSSFLKLGFK